MSEIRIDDATNEILPDATAEGELTEEDLFQMKGLSHGPTSVGVSEVGGQSIISLADSASNFDEHVGEDFDEGDDNLNTAVANGYLFGRKRPDNIKLNNETVTVLKFPKNIMIPDCPEGEDSDEWRKAFEDATVYLIGTAHFSKESQEDVGNTIKATQPDRVMIELCPARISILSMDEETLLREAGSLTTQKIIATIKQAGAVQGVLHVLLLSVSAHITRQLSMAPGGEFRAAHKASNGVDCCSLILGDRPIQITLGRALGSLSAWQRIKFFFHIMVSHFTSITHEEVEKCKDKDLLEGLLAEMAGDFPKLSEIFVDERDIYMNHGLHSLLLRTTYEKRNAWRSLNSNTNSLPFEPVRVVAVVGIGHTSGMIKRWETPGDIGPVMEMPPPSLTGKVIGTSIKLAFWGSVGYLLYRGGCRVAKRFI